MQNVTSPQYLSFFTFRLKLVREAQLSTLSPGPCLWAGGRPEESHAASAVPWLERALAAPTRKLGIQPWLPRRRAAGGCREWPVLNPRPGRCPAICTWQLGQGWGGVKVGPRGGSSPCPGRRPAPPSVCLPCGLSNGRCTPFRAAVPWAECGGFVGAHPEAPVRPASSRRGLRGSEAKAAHAQSPPASSLHLVVARAGSHKGPKQGSQGAWQGKGPPSPTAAGGWGLSRAAGRRAMPGGRLYPSPSSP